MEDYEGEIIHPVQSYVIRLLTDKIRPSMKPFSTTSVDGKYPKNILSIYETIQIEMEAQLRGAFIASNKATSVHDSKLDGGFVNYVKLMLQSCSSSR